MQMSLYIEGVYDGDEGSFIHVVLALQHRAWARIYGRQIYEVTVFDIPNQEMVLETFRPYKSVFGYAQGSATAGLWVIEFSLPDFSFPVQRVGTVAELADLFDSFTR